MSFPFELDEETDRTLEEEYTEPREYGIDFATGQMTGKIVEGIEAIKVWIWLALHTPRYRFFIYSWDYGSELEDLIGKGYSLEYIDTEIPHMIEECLLVNPNITGVVDYDFTFENDRLTVNKLTVNTTYGEVDVNV